MSTLRGLGETEREILSGLAAKEAPTVTVEDVLSISDMSRQAAHQVLSRLSRKGWIQRLKRGIYKVNPLSASTDEPVIEDPLAVAMDLFEPCYISGWTAAEHWDLTEQVFNVIVVYTTRPQRESYQEIGGVRFRVRTVPEDAMFGTTRIWSGGVPVRMATPERTVIDVLDAPEMGGGGRQSLDIVRAYWNRPIRERDDAELLQLGEKVGRGSVFKRLGFTAEAFDAPSAAWLERCQQNLTEGVALLDPSGPRTGPIVTKWRLRINLPVEDEA